MKIGELAALSGTTERQIRFLIAEGFVPAPRGGRATADYGEDHLEAIRRYGRLRELGFPPAAIRLLQQSGEGGPVPVGDGITLVVPPARIGSGADPVVHAERILALLRQLPKG